MEWTWRIDFYRSPGQFISPSRFYLKILAELENYRFSWQYVATTTAKIYHAGEKLERARRIKIFHWGHRLLVKFSFFSSRSSPPNHVFAQNPNEPIIKLANNDFFSPFNCPIKKNSIKKASRRRRYWLISHAIYSAESRWYCRYLMHQARLELHIPQTTL